MLFSLTKQEMETLSPKRYRDPITLRSSAKDKNNFPFKLTEKYCKVKL